MNRATWIRLERWYMSLNRIGQWSVKIGLGLLVVCCILVVTHEPKERSKQARIILNCDHCGTDPDRTITYNEYMDQKEQQQRIWFRAAKQQIQQDIWDEQGRQRWCRNHPLDRNCK
jgi:hypothetical protein